MTETLLPIVKTTLHKLTLEALRHKADVAGDTYDPSDPETDEWLVVETQCRAVALMGTVEALSRSEQAKDELDNYLMTDMPPRELTAIVTDLCRAGYFERHDPRWVVAMGRPIKTRVVDGVRYSTGF